VRFGGALFLDAARAWHTPLRATTPLYLDAGAGLRAELGTHRWRLDLAHGGGRWVLSAQAGAPIG